MRLMSLILSLLDDSSWSNSRSKVKITEFFPSLSPFDFQVVSQLKFWTSLAHYSILLMLQRWLEL